MSDPIPAGSRDVPSGELDNDPVDFALRSKPSLEVCEDSWFFEEPSTYNPNRKMVGVLVVSVNSSLVCAISLSA